jgi:hypothetical protein
MIRSNKIIKTRAKRALWKTSILLVFWLFCLLNPPGPRILMQILIEHIILHKMMYKNRKKKPRFGLRNCLQDWLHPSTEKMKNDENPYFLRKYIHFIDYRLCWVRCAYLVKVSSISEPFLAHRSHKSFSIVMWSVYQCITKRQRYLRKIFTNR